MVELMSGVNRFPEGIRVSKNGRYSIENAHGDLACGIDDRGRVLYGSLGQVWKFRDLAQAEEIVRLIRSMQNFFPNS